MKDQFYDKYVSSGQADNAENDNVPVPYFDFLFDHFFKDRHRDIRILDIGCGSGDLLLYLKRRSFTALHGIELSKEQVELAYKRDLHEVVSGDLMEYVKSSETAFFDVIIAKDILEHLELNELFLLVGELKRILKKGGTIVGHVPNANGIFGMKIRYGDITHAAAFNEKSLSQLFRTVGFEHIRVVEDRPRSANLLKKWFRGCMWSLLTFRYRLINYIESGEKKIALSRNITFFVN